MPWGFVSPHEPCDPPPLRALPVAQPLAGRAQPPRGLTSPSGHPAIPSVERRR